MNLFDFEAEFLKPTEQPSQEPQEEPKVIESNVGLLEAYEQHRKANPHPAYISVKDFKEQFFDKKEDDLDLYFSSGAHQMQREIAEEQIKNYPGNMPPGLRAAQIRNGIGLPLGPDKEVVLPRLSLDYNNPSYDTPISKTEFLEEVAEQYDLKKYPIFALDHPDHPGKAVVFDTESHDFKEAVEGPIFPISTNPVTGFDIEPLTDDKGQADMFGVEPTKSIEEFLIEGLSEGDKVKSPDDELKTDPVKFEFPENKPKFGRARFRKPKVEGEDQPVKNKINRTKITEHGITFDSTLERYLYNLLLAEGIEFEFQVEFVIQEAFKYRHESILPIKIRPDFFIPSHNLLVDTKGFQMADGKLKYKMLKFLLHNSNTEYRIEMPSTQKKCRELIHMMKNGFTLEEPLTEHAGTARKNKLKKAGFERIGTDWVRGEERFDPSFIMNLPKYEFEELLLKPEA